MTERERLKELLLHDCDGDSRYDGEGSCPGCKYDGMEDCTLTEHADHLLANKCHAFPCDIGDTVYTNCRMQGWYFREKDKPYKAKIVFIGLNGVDNFMNVDFGDGHMLQFPFSGIGKTVFLTREEALKARDNK